MKVRVYNPAISVRIIKRIARDGGLSQRYKDAERIIELSPFLGEGCSVTVRKNIMHDPAGTFAITLLDQLDGKNKTRSLDTIYARIEPMDYVEIRIARSPEEYGGKLPIVMRGFVTNVDRSEAIDSRGKPVRSVNVTGHDYGKLLQIVQIFTGPRFEQGQALLTHYRLFVKYGLTPNLTPANAFVRSSIDKILTPWISAMRATVGAQDGEIPFMKVDAKIPDGLVAPYGKQQFEGSLWDFISGWVDFPWNEVFVEDREEAPVLIARAAPYFDLQGKPIQSGYGLRPDIAAVVDADAIQSIRVSRSDADVANYYWVEPPATELNTRELLTASAAAHGDLFLDTPNSALALYGLRRMSAATQQIAGGVTTADFTAGNEVGRKAVAGKQEPWISRRRDLLKRMNGDNVLYEKGAITCRGNERIRPGRYVQVERGGLKWTAYVDGVQHRYAPFVEFKTSFELSRGTGFYVRSRMPNSPYLAELAEVASGGARG